MEAEKGSYRGTGGETSKKPPYSGVRWRFA
jgi:hypothetical protein